jgi:2-(1,2-epoxy-1,2-dihydrophenyl)acetyl-CoA isomerase
MTTSIPPAGLPVLLEREGAIARIRFNRPDVLNAADRALALEIALLCEPLDAAQALRLGLVNRVEPAESLESATQHLARRLAAGAPIAQGQVKHLLRDAWSRDLPAQLDAERCAFAHCAATHDFAEGVAAFLGKRPPVFQGR